MKRLSAMPDDVEDLVQESLLAIHNKRHTFDRKQPLGAWVHAIAKYKLVDFLRGRGIRESLNESLEDVGELFSHSNVEATDARRDIMKLLDQLPEKQRMPIVCTKLGRVVGRGSGREDGDVRIRDQGRRASRNEETCIWWVANENRRSDQHAGHRGKPSGAGAIPWRRLMLAIGSGRSARRS
jgi:hypothetical protein